MTPISCAKVSFCFLEETLWNASKNARQDRRGVRAKGGVKMYEIDPSILAAIPKGLRKLIEENYAASTARKRLGDA